MRYGILGPLEVWDGDRRVTVGGPQQRGLLAVLLLHANQVVSAERLVDHLWGERPPPAARSLLQGCVAALRRSLRSRSPGEHAEPDRPPLLTQPPGYLLRVRPGELDADRFEELVSRATAIQSGETGAGLAAASELLAEALSLWRGPALDGIDLAVCRAAATRWDERQLGVLEERLELDLRLGHYTGMIAELRTLVRDHPLRERLSGYLMLALYRTDRQAEALAVYRELREALVEQLGVEPGEMVQRLHKIVLSGSPADGPGHPAVRRPATGGPVPAQLPAPVGAFAGREAQLKQLDELLVGPDDGLPIGLISGMAGVGKTTLAVHWAHQYRDRFDDGQLYVNLRGFGPAGPAVPPAEAIRGFLDALDVPPQRVPASPEAQAGLYRSLLADRRMLVVLDNAADTGQVRPLLPGSSGSLVLVTSRSQLAGLVAAEGARLVPLQPLTDDEASQLLAHRVGADRVAGEPDAVGRILARCGGLPLAVAIVAARVATHPDFPLAVLAGELGESGDELDEFDGDDPAIDIRAVFSWSYRTLSAAAARAFRLLGLHPGPDFDAPAVASLAGMPTAQVRPLLSELARAHLLLIGRTHGRLCLHDLLRAYATELTRTHDPDHTRRAATRRLTDHYLHTGHAAALLIHPHRLPISLEPAAPGGAAGDLADADEALAWFSAEHDVLLAAVEQAGRTGLDAHVWQLAWTLTDYFDRRGHWHDMVTVHTAGLDAARRLADRNGQAHAHRLLGRALVRLDRAGEALTHYQQALHLFGELTDHAGQGHTHLGIGGILSRSGREHEALDHARQALDLFRTIDHRAGQATALNNVGLSLARVGAYREAAASCQQALELSREVGDRLGQAAASDSLGYANHQMGNHHQAISDYQHAVDLLRDLGDQYYEAGALSRLGDVHRDAGSTGAARHAWRQAADILDELDHPDADQVRAKLRNHPD